MNSSTPSHGYLSSSSWIFDITLPLAYIYLAWTIVVAIYRIYFHPLAEFPGPKLAAATQWYRTYFEYWCGGKMYQRLVELHLQYGPVVRVGPNELHYDDASAFHSIYSMTAKLTKDPTLYSSFGNYESTFVSVSPIKAKAHRELLAPFFSRRSVIDLQGLVQESIDKLCEILSKCNEQPVSLYYAFRSLTMDNIMSFAFAKCPDALDYPGFIHPILIAMEASLSSFMLFKNFPLVRQIITSLPYWLSTRVAPEMKGYLDLQKTLTAQIDELFQNPGCLDDAPHPLIYHSILKPPKGQSIAPRMSLIEEAQTLLFAGSDTVGIVLTTGIFHVAKNKQIGQRLAKELDEAYSCEKQNFGSLEKLPYLTAVIKESLRLSPTVPVGLPRVVPSTGHTICGKRIPASTVVSSGIYFIHLNPTNFTNPKHFDPERWLQPDSVELERFLVPFSKGPRQCLGIK